jgi:excisionase family DNA binding protein
MNSHIMAYLKNLGPRLLSSRETATILNCHLETLYKWVKAGAIQHTRIGGRVKFSPAQVLAYLKDRTV